jgi:starch synthase
MDNNTNLSLLYVTPEIVPFAATGGLADVSEALPAALQTKGINVTRVMPKFLGIEKKYPLKKEFSFIVEAGGKANIANVYKMVQDEVVTYFIGNDNYFEREYFYGYEDDYERFGFFCKAILEMLIFLDLKPDVIHLNDWQTALTGLLLKEEYQELEFYNDIKVVFTIHNLQYQGVFDKSALQELNLSPRYFDMEGIEYYGKVCYMKAGIVYADLITTVSKTYAKEIQTPWFGYGLDGILRKHSNKIDGIVNGIYYDKYNPETDEALDINFTSQNFEVKRKEQKKALQRQLGLPVRDVPIFGVVTRLAEQKGIDLILSAIEELIHKDIQFVILGSGDKYYEHRFKELSIEYKDKIGINIVFDQKLARRIYASTDFFLMPSLFEPCGLSQLYSLRYGGVPIVRKTGGLVDTIDDYNKEKKIGTGFVFKNYNNKEFIMAINRGLEIYEDKIAWDNLVKTCMEKRFSWDVSAEKYIQRYMELSNNK